MFPDLPPRPYESLKALCCLATAKKPMRAIEIAALAYLPPAQTAKILQEMTWAGFVESRRGTNGGFWLLKPAAEIRVIDVVTFFDHRAPSRELNDPILQTLAQATRRCRKNLELITIADLAKLPALKADRKKAPRKTPNRPKVENESSQDG